MEPQRMLENAIASLAKTAERALSAPEPSKPLLPN
jgi:hypothetical protein